MKTSTKLILAGSLISFGGAAISALALYATTKQMLCIALDRKKPKTMGKAPKVSGITIPPEIAEEITVTAEKLRNNEFETVEITSHDGVRLVGHWHRCGNSKRVIIAMHGWRSNWDRDFGAVADFWFNNNCDVLFAEQRAQNNSGGEYMGFGMLERHDCPDWIDWVNQQTGEQLPIYLSGLSMGASTVLMATELDLAENVCGVIADCGFTSPHDIWKHVAENNLHMSYGLREKIADSMCQKKIHMGTKDCSAPEALKRSKVPVLFIHGTDDHFVPVEMTYENYKACNSPKRLFVVPGAEHGMSYRTDREGYEEAVRKFWTDFDGTQGGNPEDPLDKRADLCYNKEDQIS